MQTQSDHDERRQHPRFTLKAYGLNHFCQVQRKTQEENEKAQLVDITPAGARLRFVNGETPPQSGDTVVVDLQLELVSPPGLGLDSLVRWSDTAECGVQFKQELDCGVTELQRLLDETSHN